MRGMDQRRKAPAISGQKCDSRGGGHSDTFRQVPQDLLPVLKLQLRRHKCEHIGLVPHRGQHASDLAAHAVGFAPASNDARQAPMQWDRWAAPQVARAANRLDLQRLVVISMVVIGGGRSAVGALVCARTNQKPVSDRVRNNAARRQLPCRMVAALSRRPAAGRAAFLAPMIRRAALHGDCAAADARCTHEAARLASALCHLLRPPGLALGSAPVLERLGTDCLQVHQASLRYLPTLPGLLVFLRVDAEPLRDGLRRCLAKQGYSSGATKARNDVV